MLTDFLDSWALFGDAYAAGWLIAACLGVCGVLLAARDQIFLGAAVAQSTTLGLAVALTLGSALAAGTGAALPDAHGHVHGPDAAWFASDRFALLVAVAFGALGAWVTTWGGESGGESREALTGWVFLLSGSGAVLLLTHSPHGLEEIKRLHAGTMLGATRQDLTWSACFALAVAAVFLARWRPILLQSVDPEHARACGIPVGRWNAGFLIALGLGLTLAIRCAGTLYAFGCLALPALAARHLCRELRGMLVVAPIVAVLGAAAGFVAAHRFDWPPAHAATAVLAALLPLAWLWRRLFA